MKVPADCTNSSGVTATFQGGMSGMGGMNMSGSGMGSGSGTTGSSTTGGMKSGSSSVLGGQSLLAVVGAAGFAMALLFTSSL
jgi:hypothetical protein